jgi:hypothetical protein
MNASLFAHAWVEGKKLCPRDKLRLNSIDKPDKLLLFLLFLPPTDLTSLFTLSSDMSGLSHLLLKTVDRKLYESTAEFYKALGFVSVSHDDRQICLRLTASSPAQEFTLKLKLIDSQAVDKPQHRTTTIVIASENLEVSSSLHDDVRRLAAPR